MYLSLRNIRFILLMAGALTLLSSCYTEQSVATRFVRKTAQEKPSVWFIGASYIFRTCLNEEKTDGDPCPLLSAINDSAFLEDYNRNFALQLQDYGYQVFTYDESEAFFGQKGLGLIINIAQLEIEELTDNFTDSDVFDTLQYFEVFPVTRLRLNSWIEVSLVDTTQAKHEMYYASASISDLIEGYFTQHPLKGDVSYTYKRYDMKPPITVRFVKESAREHAQKLFDLWMNRYIHRNMGETRNINVTYGDKGYYHYNPVKKRIEMVDPTHALEKL